MPALYAAGIIIMAYGKIPNHYNYGNSQMVFGMTFGHTSRGHYHSACRTLRVFYQYAI